MGLHHARGRETQWAAELALIHGRWGEQLLSDPQYSPNLSLDALELWEPAFPRRVSYPWRLERTTGDAALLAAARS
jgi:hypothetical protein